MDKAAPNHDDYSMVELKNDVKWIKKILETHISHHTRYEATLYIAFIIACVGVVAGFF